MYRIGLGGFQFQFDPELCLLVIMLLLLVLAGNKSLQVYDSRAEQAEAHLRTKSP